MKISLSIADMPFNLRIEDLFSFASALGFDGVEVLPGVKTFSTIACLSKHSEKFNLPVLSIHHPFWVSRFIISSKKTFQTAQHFNALMVVHPLISHALSSPQQKKFLDEIAHRSQQYNVAVTLENITQESFLPIYKYFSRAHDTTTKLPYIYKTCIQYGFGVTLDTSHLKKRNILSVEGFSDVEPMIKNIHLSDYNDRMQHVALGDGQQDTESFVKHLKKNHYTGLLTLELSPRIYSERKKYFSDIEKSFVLIKKLLGPARVAEEKKIPVVGSIDAAVNLVRSRESSA